MTMTTTWPRFHYSESNRKVGRIKSILLAELPTFTLQEDNWHTHYIATDAPCTFWITPQSDVGCQRIINAFAGKVNNIGINLSWSEGEGLAYPPAPLGEKCRYYIPYTQDFCIAAVYRSMLSRKYHTRAVWQCVWQLFKTSQLLQVWRWNRLLWQLLSLYHKMKS